MTFAYPWVLLILPLVVAVLAGWVAGAERSRRRAVGLSRRRPPRPPYLAAALIALAAATALVAAAGPRWGSRTREIPREGVDVIFVVDVSRSMAATDTAPSRMAAARAAIDNAIGGLEGDRVGLVIFGGSGYLRFPPTTDLDAAREVVASLDAGAVFVEPGSSIAAGFDAALRLPPPEDDGARRVIVLVSDGDDLGEDPRNLATVIGEADYDLLVAGVGTPGGSTIPVFDPREESPVEKLDEDGQPLISRLNESLLVDVARAANGRYVADLALLPGALQGQVAGLREARIDERTAEVPIERFQLFAAAALGLLILGIVAERLPALLRRGGRGAVAVAGLLAAVAVLFAGCSAEAYDANEEGLRAFEAGDYDRATELFREAREEQPREFQLSINLAMALFAAGDNDGAIAAARQAAESAQPELRATSHAAVGHIQFAAGELDGALDSFREALREDPLPAYRHNYEVVLRLLEPTPTPEPTPSPEPSPSAEPSASPGDPGATPSPGPNGPGTTPGPSDGGTPQPGDPTGGLPQTVEEAESLIDEIDAEIAAIQDQAGPELTREEALDILDLIAERSRIAALRESLGGRNDPGDY
jgi:Ca-activated chloride channel family protein